MCWRNELIEKIEKVVHNKGKGNNNNDSHSHNVNRQQAPCKALTKNAPDAQAY